jgi:hypothetical protein
MDKSRPVYDVKTGGVEVHLLLLLASALDAGNRSTSCPGPSMPNENPALPTEQGGEWAPQLVWTYLEKGKFYTLLIRTCLIQPTALSLY